MTKAAKCKKKPKPGSSCSGGGGCASCGGGCSSCGGGCGGGDHHPIKNADCGSACGSCRSPGKEPNVQMKKKRGGSCGGGCGSCSGGDGGNKLGLDAIKTIVSNYDLTHVKKRLYAEMDWNDSFCDEVIDEYKKFVTIALHCGYAVPSKIVDEAWHNHILFTKDYFVKFASSINDVLHHSPTDEDDEDEVSENISAYNKTLENYKLLFNCTPPNHIW